MARGMRRLGTAMARGMRRRGGNSKRERAGLCDATLCVTQCELNNRHGSGVILSQIFAREPALAVIYSLRLFDGECVGDLSLHILQRTDDPAESVAPITA